MFVLYFILIARSIIRSPTTTQSIGTISNPRTDLSNPMTDLSNPRTDLSNPRTDLSNPRTDLPNPRTDLSNPSTDLSHSTILNNKGKVTTIGDLIEEVYDNTDKEVNNSLQGVSC